MECLQKSEGDKVWIMVKICTTFEIWQILHSSELDENKSTKFEDIFSLRLKNLEEERKRSDELLKKRIQV